jgi:hypothetical protein
VKHDRTYQKDAKGWIAEIEDAKAAKRQFEERYKLAKQDYEAERIAHASGAFSGEYPIHWANIRTLRPNLFFRRPPARVVRHHQTRTIPQHILASEILEQNLEKTLSSQPFEDRMRLIVTHALNSGLGQVWLRYEYETEEKEEGYEDLADEQVCIEIVHPDDYLCNRARYDDEVLWIGRALYFTRDELKEHFSNIDIRDLSWGSTRAEDRGKEADELSNFARAKVWEIWSKPDEKQYFIADGYDKQILKERKPKRSKKKVEFSGFFPCPRPLVLGSEALDSVYPICDHHYYRVQAGILNDLQDKSKELISKGIKVAGVYDQSAAKDVYSLLMASHGDYTPADFDETNVSGGWDAVVKMFPADRYAQVLQVMDAAAQEQLKRVYEVTGMSDILRGQGDPSETATAQKIKEQSASMRLNEMRLLVSSFVNEVYEKAGDMIASCYDWRTLLVNAGLSLQGLKDGKDGIPEVDPAYVQQFQDPEQQQQAMAKSQMIIEAIKLLRDERARFFVIDVESEDMLKRNDEREKEGAYEFANALTNIITQFSQVAQTVPTLMMLLPELVMSVVRKYDKGKRFEQKIEDLLKKYVEQQQQPPPPPEPDPFVQIEQMKAQTQQMKVQQDAQLEQYKLQQQGQLEQMKLQQEAQLEQLKLQLSQAFQQRDADREDFLAQLKAQELQLKAQEQGQRIELEVGRLYQQGEIAKAQHELEAARVIQDDETQEARQELEAAKVLVKDKEVEHQRYKDEVELRTTGVMR